MTHSLRQLRDSPNNKGFIFRNKISVYHNFFLIADDCPIFKTYKTNIYAFIFSITGTVCHFNIFL